MIDYVPFQADLIPEAATLLANRHCQDRLNRPELPPRFELSEATQQALTLACQRPHTQGVAALQGGKLLGYLFGTLTLNSLWGRTGWVRPVGCALDRDSPLDLLAELYARLGQQWIDYGCFAHYVITSILDSALVETWFSLGFGIEQVHGLYSMRHPVSDDQNATHGVEIRLATLQDQEALSAFSDVIWRQHVQAPCWAVQLPEIIGKTREGWAKMVDDSKVDLWLALSGDRLLGVQGYWKNDPEADALLLPDHCVSLGIAGTHPAARRRGIARALMQVGLTHSQRQGYLYCETDWRSANLLARHCWPKLGFAPYAYRLVRRLDERISWACGDHA